MNRVGIIGLGLMGGSLALALRKSEEIAGQIVGFSRRPGTSAAAAERGMIDVAARDLASVVEGADLVFIATPVMTIREVLERISRHLSSGCIVTDVGSTKVKVMEWAVKYLPLDVGFIGGHPMAGKETSGIDEADSELFRGCAYCLCPGARATSEAVGTLERVVRGIGARPVIVEASVHDRLVAGVSHLPMVLSAAFVACTVEDSLWTEMGRLAAGGYRDLSRLASGNPEMNRDICGTNAEEIIQWIDRYVEKLSEYRRLIAGDAEGLENALALAREARERWLREASG